MDSGSSPLSIFLLDLLQVSAHNIRLPKQSTVGDVINELKTKVSSFASQSVRECVQASLSLSMLFHPSISFSTCIWHFRVLINAYICHPYDTIWLTKSSWSELLFECWCWGMLYWLFLFILLVLIRWSCRAQTLSWEFLRSFTTKYTRWVVCTIVKREMFWRQAYREFYIWNSFYSIVICMMQSLLVGNVYC